jgi:ATP-dependent helicase YprA (DUF1998 family)
VTEIRIAYDMTEAEAASVLYALIEGADALSIARDDIDGTFYRFAVAAPPALVLYDNVPGGAGHAQRIAENLPELFRNALARVQSCECGPETSCYTCLRSYSNQRFHEQLSRGSAAEILRHVLGSEIDGASNAQFEELERDLEFLEDEVRSLVQAAMRGGAPLPIVGWEPDTPEGWVVEAAWPTHRVAVLMKREPALDAWLLEQGWTALTASEWSVEELVKATSR